MKDRREMYKKHSVVRKNNKIINNKAHTKKLGKIEYKNRSKRRNIYKYIHKENIYHP